MDIPTVHQARQHARLLLRSTSDAPELDASWILLHVLKKTAMSYLHTQSAVALTTTEFARYQRLIERRRNGEPLAYIIGYSEFYGRPFRVTKDVLIPRPSTEAVVQQALAYIQKQGRELTIADVGTGSGCIIVSLALELTDGFRFMATDISPRALTLARQNAMEYGVEKKIAFRQGDLLEPLKDMQLDLIVSNPPYVPTVELNHAQVSPTPETIGLTYEPRFALDGGPDGRRYIDQILKLQVPTIMETRNGQVEHYFLQTPSV